MPDAVILGDGSYVAPTRTAAPAEPGSIGAPPSDALVVLPGRPAPEAIGSTVRVWSLGATSLLHEAYFDLSRRDGAQFPDRQRFMAYASRVMRGLIVDYARNRQTQKRGGQFELTALSTDVLDVVHAGESAADLVRISDALDDLSTMEPLLAEVVDLKYFCGFSFEEIAAMKNLSERTVRRYWTKARAYLHVQLSDGGLPSE